MPREQKQVTREEAEAKLKGPDPLTLDEIRQLTSNKEVFPAYSERIVTEIALHAVATMKSFDRASRILSSVLIFLTGVLVILTAALVFYTVELLQVSQQPAWHVPKW
jgi:hypothetical protein